MARLIDADALKEQIESHVVSMSVCLSVDEHYGKVTMREECLQDIANAPTIDAIPVEWLNKQCEMADDRGDMEMTDAISWLIQTWQEEQEAR